MVLAFFVCKSHKKPPGREKTKGRTSAVKTKLILLTVALALLLTGVTCALPTHAKTEDGENTIPDNAFITYGYLQSILEDLRLELLEELTGQGGSITIESNYKEVSLKKGDVLVLSTDCEAIFRGGNAAVITSTCSQGEGLTDLSMGTECFSGDLLSFGHIYYKTTGDSRAYILVTGDKAAFTLRGTYEIR